MKLLILYIFLSCSLITKGQVIEDNIQTHLINPFKIDSFLIYSLECSGDMISLDTCGYEKPKYVFWKQDSKYFLKKFDYCNEFKTIQIDSNNPLRFYIVNKEIIDKEEIKNPTYYNTKGNKSSIVTLTVDHACYHELTLHLKTNSKIKHVNTYYLDFAKFDNGRKNIFYNTNQKTKLKSLTDKISELIKKLEISKVFQVE
jgi:hypothetical protein